MPEVTLVAEAGRIIGSAPARRLRAEGKIPGIIYGHGMDPLPVAILGREFRTALSGEAGLNTLLSLRVDGGEKYLTMARTMQRHPIRGTVTHVDFQVVRSDEIMTAEVPITLIGEAAAVNREDGMVEQQLFSLTIKATPQSIPAALEVDISELTIGQTLRVSEMTLPRGVEVDTDPEAPVAVGQPSRVSGREEGEEGEATGEPGAAEETGAEAAG
jgi:large subunit ribosomal protein L25